MKTDFTKLYHDLLNRYIAETDKNCILGPEEVNTIRFNLRGLLVAYFIVARECPSAVLSEGGIKEWILSKFGGENIFLKVIDECPDKIVEELLREAPAAPTDDIGYTYETFLSIDANSTQAEYDDRNRNETGSYFTPVELADFTIDKVVSHFVSENTLSSLSSAKVADFSCGSGVFLTEYMNHVASLGIDKEIVAENLYGFDVDPIVLEIAKYNILREIGDLGRYAVISKHFTHCNFLLNSCTETNNANRLGASRRGYIYNPALSVDLSSLSHFEIILGNPPWEKIRFEEKAIKELYCGASGEKLQKYIETYQRDIEAAKRDIKKSEFFANANNGELNTYALFTKAAINLLSAKGRLGLIVKSSLVTSQVYSKFFKEFREEVFIICDFVNTKKIFDIDGRERFSVVCISKQRNNKATVGMNISSVCEADSRSEAIELADCDIINPVTGTLPNVRSIEEFEMLVDMHRKARYFYNEYTVKYGRLVHLTNHRNHIIKEEKKGYLPIYEGKFIAQFDANYSGFNHVPEDKKYTSKATSSPLSPEEVSRGIHPQSRYYISEEKWKEISHTYTADYMLAWHSLTSATNSITCVATVLPFMPTCQSIQFLTIKENIDLLYLTGLFNSAVFEYILKKKLNGIDLTRAIIDQMPVPSKDDSTEISLGVKRYRTKDVIVSAVSYLLKDDDRLSSLVSVVIRPDIAEHIKSREEALLYIDEAVAVQYGISGEQLLDIKKALA